MVSSLFCALPGDRCGCLTYAPERLRGKALSLLLNSIYQYFYKKPWQRLDFLIKSVCCVKAFEQKPVTVLTAFRELPCGARQQRAFGEFILRAEGWRFNASLYWRLSLYFAKLSSQYEFCIGFWFCIILRRLFRRRRPLFAVGVLAPEEALCREAGVKQSGITVIFYRPCIFRFGECGIFCFFGKCAKK